MAVIDQVLAQTSRPPPVREARRRSSFALLSVAASLVCLVASAGASTGFSPGQSSARSAGNGTIVFWRDSSYPSLWTIRPDGSHLKLLVRTKGNAKRPTLSPDRSWIAFDGALPGQPPMESFHVQIVRIDGTRRHALAASSAWELDAQWAPDGHTLSFSRMPPGPDWLHSWIWLVNRDGRSARRVARGQYARWAPDGHRLVLDTPTAKSQGDLFIVTAGGRVLRRLTWTPLLEQPTGWSPDGDTILFTRFDESGGSDVFAIDVAGGAIRRLTHRGHDGGASWSPDGRTIVFTSERTGSSRLYLMNADGSGQRILAGGPIAFDPAWR